jgi:hypothetical protein
MCALKMLQNISDVFRHCAHKNIVSFCISLHTWRGQPTGAMQLHVAFTIRQLLCRMSEAGQSTDFCSRLTTECTAEPYEGCI